MIKPAIKTVYLCELYEEYWSIMRQNNTKNMMNHIFNSLITHLSLSTFLI